MNDKNDNVFSSNLMVFVGIGLAALYWFVESLLYVFSFNLNLFQLVFRPDLTGLYRRLLVFSILLILGSHAQSAIKKHKEAEEVLREYSRRLEKEVEKNV